MKVVFKYPFQIDDEVAIVLPYCAEILRFDIEAGTPTIWARVVSGAPQEIRRFRICATGREDAEGCYVGTAALANDELVHLFEIITDKTEWATDKTEWAEE